MKVWGYPVAVFALACTTENIPCLSASTLDDFGHVASTNWPAIGGDWSNTHYSSLSKINVNNVNRLNGAWISRQFIDDAASWTPPVVKDGLMFVTAGRTIYALNARTGAQVWIYQTIADARPSDSTDATGPSGSAIASLTAAPNWKGVGLGEGLVFVGLQDGHVIALEETTGKLAWIVQTGIAERKNGQRAAVAPTYYDGRLFTGLSDGDYYQRGRVTALEARTGRKLWQIFTIPGPGEAGHETWSPTNDAWKFGGGGVWTSPTIDPELGLIYVTTGNAVPAFAGDLRPGNNLYTSSVLALDMATGAIKWYYQLVHHDVFEADLGTQLILYETKFHGISHKAVAAMRGDGYLFQLDRETGKPILPVEERSVPQLESQKTSLTQPFPVTGESFLKSCNDWKKEPIPAGFQVGCMWTPPASPPPSTDAQNVLAPTPWVKGSPMAYSPLTKYFYVNGISALNWPRRSQDPYFLNWSNTVPGIKSYVDLAAIDSATGKVVWKQPLPAGMFFNGGPIVTAGGLLFRASPDGNVQAFSAKTGERLWQFQTGMNNGGGSPASYEIDGEQYIAMSMGRAIWAFKLGGGISPAAPPKSADDLGQFTGPIVDTHDIETTSLQRSLIEPGIRYFVDEYTFNPYRARVRVGEPIVFVNNGSLTHEIVSLDGHWGTGPLSPTQQAWLTFDKPGEYTFICKTHPWSYGQLIVVPRQVASNDQAADESPQSAVDLDKFQLRVQVGEASFAKHCAECHGADLRGRGAVPPLSGDNFMSHWDGQEIRSIFDRIRNTMPQSNPGSLDDVTYLDIAIYLLKSNNVFFGERERTADSQGLENTPIRKMFVY